MYKYKHTCYVMKIRMKDKFRTHYILEIDMNISFTSITRK